MHLLKLVNEEQIRLIDLGFTLDLGYCLLIVRFECWRMLSEVLEDLSV